MYFYRKNILHTREQNRWNGTNLSSDCFYFRVRLHRYANRALFKRRFAAGRVSVASREELHPRRFDTVH